MAEEGIGAAEIEQELRIGAQSGLPDGFCILWRKAGDASTAL
jgi:hypothetical protein